MSLKDNLKEAREGLELSINQLSDLSSVPTSVISRIEAGIVRRPTLKTLEALSGILGKSVRALEHGTDDAYILPIGTRRLRVLTYEEALRHMENPGKSKFSAGMTDFTSVPVSDRAFILMVKDDSMSPDLRSGEWVVVDPDVDPEPGNLVFAVNPETGKPDIRAFADLRQVGGGPSVYELRPANSFYPIWRYESSRPKLLGTLIERRVPLRRLQPKK